MLRSRGISQIYHTYSEDMHPYILCYRGYIPLRATAVAEDIWVHILLVGVVYPIHVFMLTQHICFYCVATALDLASTADQQVCFQPQSGMTLPSNGTVEVLYHQTISDGILEGDEEFTVMIQETSMTFNEAHAVVTILANDAGKYMTVVVVTR